MSITTTEFKARFPEFNSIADATIEIHIEDSELILNESYWGDKYELGQAYFVAHVLSISQSELSGNQDSTKSVASKSVDGVSVTFAIPTTNSKNENDSYYATTSYGRKYLALRKTLGVVAFNV